MSAYIFIIIHSCFSRTAPTPSAPFLSLSLSVSRSLSLSLSSLSSFSSLSPSYVSRFRSRFLSFWFCLRVFSVSYPPLLSFIYLPTTSTHLSLLLLLLLTLPRSISISRDIPSTTLNDVTWSKKTYLKSLKVKETLVRWRLTCSQHCRCSGLEPPNRMLDL